MDEVTHGWTGVRELLRGLKEQVSLSTEWLEIREILDDISSELDACANMVFELEEMRHLGLASKTSTTPSHDCSPTESVELDRLTSILEQHTDSSRSNPHQHALLRLSARIQPLRASLDFLSPRLSSFSTRAEKTFPTALEGVVQRKNDLEKRWNQVESDWKSISREFQEDEWVVADPSTLTAAVLNFRRYPERLADPSDGVIYRAIAVGAEIQNIHFLLRSPDGEKHGIDAVLHVKIGLALLPVAEHPKDARVSLQLVIEIKYMAVCIAFSQNRHKSENVRLKSEAIAICSDQAFARRLGCAIQRGLDGEGRIFRCGNCQRLSVHRTRR